MHTKIKERRNFDLFNSITILILVAISGISIIILGSNIEVFCFPKNDRVIPISNVDLFFIYSVIFTIVNVLLLKFSTKLKLPDSKIKTILFVITLSNQLLISFILLMIYGQIKIISLYSNDLFYTIIYGSLFLSAAFLTVAGVQFVRWFTYGKNYLVLLYGVVLLVLSTNSVISILYMWEVSLSHSSIIQYSSCSAMLGSIRTGNPEQFYKLQNLYDVTSLFSFILAWLATVFMLKEYSKGKNKIIYWILVLLPLIFFLSRYEVGLYYFLGNEQANILTSVNINSDVYGYQFIESLLNLNLQLGGAFFGLAFFVIALKLTRDPQKKALAITGIGIMFLFGSKDISTLIISSYPPLGAVSITFMGIASYFIYLGIYSAATLTSRDKDLRRNLHEKIENDFMLLRSISSSQHHIDIERSVKKLMNLSIQWQEDNEQQDMTEDEIRIIVNDVISELKTSKKK